MILINKDGAKRELTNSETIELFIQNGWVEVKEAPKKEEKKNSKKNIEE